MSEKRKRASRAINIIEGVVIAVLILLIAGMLFLYFTFSETGAAPNILGFTIYHTKAVSMQPEIPAGAAVIAKSSETDSVKVGSVVLCTIGENTVLTRVRQILSENGELSYIVQFDTDSADKTFKIPAENVIAKAIWTSRALGAALSFATSTLGIMLVIIIPSFVIIVLQVVRIINAKRAEEDAFSLDDLDEIMLPDNSDTEINTDVFSEPMKPSSQLRPLSFNTDTAEKISSSELKFTGNKDAASGNTPLFTYDRLSSAAASQIKWGAEEKNNTQPTKDNEPKPEPAPEIAPKPEPKQKPIVQPQEEIAPKPEPKPASVRPAAKRRRAEIKNTELAIGELMSMINEEESKLK